MCTQLTNLHHIHRAEIEKRETLQYLDGSALCNVPLRGELPEQSRDAVVRAAHPTLLGLLEIGAALKYPVIRKDK